MLIGPVLCFGVAVAFLVVWLRDGEWSMAVVSLLLFCCYGGFWYWMARHRWYAHLWGEKPIRRPFSDW